MDNWLLDLELAHCIFTADKRSLILQDFGNSGDVLRDIVDEYPEFFRSGKRKDDLKERLSPSDDSSGVKAKMVAILIGEKEHLLRDIWRNLLAENSVGKNDAILNIEKFGLASYHWQETKKIYGYDSSNPSVDDFVLWLFKIALDGFQSSTPNEYRNVQSDFNNLKYDSRFKEAYKLLARRAAMDLNFDDKLDEIDFRKLVNIDLFESIDGEIIDELSRGVADRTISAKETSDYVQKRRNTFWFEEYSGLYSAIEAASGLLNKIDTLNLSMQFFNDGIEKYTRDWFQIDQLYRQFLYHARASEEAGPLEQLKKQIEGSYPEQIPLSPLGIEWQKQVDASTSWFSTGYKNQTSFFDEYVQNSTVKKVVIISDAMRYEIAEELGTRIKKEDKFESELDAMLGVLPSYTQLGMAALLPHKELRHAAGDKALVEIDGKPAGGTSNRNKILEPHGGMALQAEDFLNMDGTTHKALIRDNQIVYIYHNRIDKTGDNISSEARVFEEVEKVFGELISLVKKLASANASNILITADHGFLYQHGGLDERGYLSVEPHGDEIFYLDRRFVLGKNLKEDPAFKTFKPQQPCLEGDVEVQIQKSTHRLRRKGSGSRFVHGGATLQEIVVPVLSIKKKRKTDVRKVGVEILPETDKITTRQNRN
ncbi:MAG: BREX-1 system phosphatase PglZ type A [Acidimicrobiia bacterium]